MILIYKLFQIPLSSGLRLVHTFHFGRCGFFLIFSDNIISNDSLDEENFMIILFDIEEQKIDIYNKNGMHSLPLINASSLFDYINDEPIYYVTNAIEVDMMDIVNMIREMGVPIEKVNPAVLSTNQYIHAVSNETIYINEQLRFKGRTDFKLIDDKMKEIMDQNPTLQILIKNKKIEIINELQKSSLIKEIKEMIKKEVKMQETSDKVLDKLILKTSVKNHDGLSNEESDAEEINLDSDVGGFRSLTPKVENIGGLSIPQPQTMSELESYMG